MALPQWFINTVRHHFLLKLLFENKGIFGFKKIHVDFQN